MLIKVTQACSMACTHCMENSLPKDPSMDYPTFVKALKFSARVEGFSWKRNGFGTILLSGGECTEHPEFVKFLESAMRFQEHVAKQGVVVMIMLITHGKWLTDPVLRKAILRPEWPFPRLGVQVTNDPRFYPELVELGEADPRVQPVDKIGHLMRLGRGKKLKSTRDGSELPPESRAPSSFNFRSAVRWYRELPLAIHSVRTPRALLVSQGYEGGSTDGKACSPSILVDGTFVAGETRFCWPIGTIDSTNDEIVKKVLEMGSCNRCGAESNLGQAERRALGLSRLYLPTEK